MQQYKCDIGNKRPPILHKTKIYNIQSVPKKSDTIEIVQIFGQSENVLKCLTVNTIH